MVDFQMKMALESEKLELNQAVLKSGIESVIENKNLGNYFIALKDTKPVAMLLTIPEWSDWRCRSVLWIHSVYVAPDYRKQGIYKKLYLHLKDLVDSDDKYAGLRLYVDKSNISAINVYENLGMSNEHYELYEYLKEG